MLISSICDSASVSFRLSVEHLENLSFQTCWNSSLKCPLLSAFLLRTIDCVNTEPQFLDISQQTPSHHQLAVLYSESLWHINGLWLCTFVEVDLIFSPICCVITIIFFYWIGAANVTDFLPHVIYVRELQRCSGCVHEAIFFPICVLDIYQTLSQLTHFKWLAGTFCWFLQERVSYVWEKVCWPGSAAVGKCKWDVVS